MGQNLVIVESPAKAKTISKYLGKNYTVEASMGHVRDLPKSKLGVDIEDNFNPKYITIRGKGELIAKLKKAAKKADKIYLATDPDREGEAISWHLANILKISEDDTCRIVFNEITKSAVKESIKEARKKDMLVIGFLGKSGGKIKEMCDIALVVPSDNTPRIQEVHTFTVHLLCEIIERGVFQK